MEYILIEKTQFNAIIPPCVFEYNYVFESEVPSTLGFGNLAQQDLEEILFNYFEGDLIILFNICSCPDLIF